MIDSNRSLCPMTDETTADLKALVASVAAGYFTNSHIAPYEIPSVIAQIAASLSAIPSGGGSLAVGSAAVEAPKPVPAVGIRASVKPDRIICLGCGKPQKTIRRHIMSAHGQTPEQYREHWGLKADYPMVAPSYSEARSELAKKFGLGQRGQQARKSARRGRGRNGTADAEWNAAVPETKPSGSTEPPSMSPVRRGTRKKAAEYMGSRPAE
jgi:predicted transcriptional regulator